MYVRTILQNFIHRVDAQRVNEFLGAAGRGDVDTVKKVCTPRLWCTPPEPRVVDAP